MAIRGGAGLTGHGPGASMTDVFGHGKSRWLLRLPSGIRGLAVGLAIAGAALPAAHAAGVPVPAKADILSVEIERKPMRTVSYFGAGIRAPHQAGPDAVAESDSVRVEWFAHSPGIPPGVLVMLETIPDRQPTVRSLIQRQSSKSEGNYTARFDIPDDETRESGPIGEWRVRIVWRGRLLATRTSAGWKAARKEIP